MICYDLGVCYDDWLGNDHDDKQAKEGAETHGYTDAQKYAIKLNISLFQRIQTHMSFTYSKYSNNRLVRKDSEDNKKVKGTRTGAVGRPTILPKQLGHEIKIC
eukprot:3023164-Heterocapsa_arctica.AAC.1